MAPTQGKTPICDPITLVGVGLGIGQSVLGYQAAKSQYSAQRAAYQQNAENAAMATAQTYSNLNIRSQQEGAAHAQAAQQSEIEKAQAVASAEVAAAAGGVSGLSVDAVIRDIYAQAGRNDAAADANLRMNADYITGEKKAAEASGQSQINSMPAPEKPSAVPFLLQGFASELNSYTGYKQRKDS